MARDWLSISTHRLATGWAVKAVGEVDLYTGPELQEALDSCLFERPVNLKIDLTGVTFLDLQGVRILAETLRRARKRGVSVQFLLSDSIGRVITLCEPLLEGLGEGFGKGFFDGEFFNGQVEKATAAGEPGLG